MIKRLFPIFLLLSIIVNSNCIIINAKAEENQDYMTADDFTNDEYMSNLMSSLIPDTNIELPFGKYVYYPINSIYKFSDGSTMRCAIIFRLTNDAIFTPNGSDVNSESDFVLIYRGICDLNTVKETVDALNSGMNVDLDGNMDSRIVADLEIAHQKYFSNYNKSYNYLRPANAAYNCHSYAWYSQSEDNIFWIDSPNAYYSDSDKSYRELNSTESPIIGDIIVYRDGNTPTHSGIITDYVSGATTDGRGGANMYIVESKWSCAGLYRHKGDECPYYEIDSGNFNVTYYRPQSDEQIDVTNGNPEMIFSEIVSAKSEIGVTSAEEKNFTVKLNITESGTQTITVQSVSPLSCILMDSRRIIYGSVQITETIESGLYTYTFSGYFAVGTYYLRSEFSNYSIGGQIDLKIAHQHGQYAYSSLGANGHRVLCRCGYYYTAGHVVKGSVLGRYKPCVSCGYIIDTEGSGFFPGIMKTEHLSECN